MDHPDLSACPEATAPALDLACDLEYVLVSPRSGGMWGTVDDVLTRNGLKRRVRVSAPSFLAAIELVARTDLVAVLPQRLVRAATTRRLTVRPFPLDLPSFDLLAVWHARSHADPLQKFSRRVLFELGAMTAPPR